MASDVTLTAAVRTNLLSLQNTQSLEDTTQSRLSTGLKVGSAIDDPVAYFQAKALSDRASDLGTKKGFIDQGISSLSTALEGVNGVQNLVQQLKGLALNAQSSSGAQVSGLVTQYNTLRSQINLLVADTQYQGLNLINGTGQQLLVSFSNLTGSNMVVNSVNVQVGAAGLNLAKAVTANGLGFQLSFDDATSATLYGGSVLEAIWSGTATTLESGTYSFAYGSANVFLTVKSAGFSGNAGDLNALTTTQIWVAGQKIGINTSTGNTDSYKVTSGDIQNGNRFAVEFSANTAAGINGFVAGATISGVYLTGLTGTGLNSGTYTFAYGTQYNITFTVLSAGGISQGTLTTTQMFGPPPAKNTAQANDLYFSFTVASGGAAPTGAYQVSISAAGQSGDTFVSIAGQYFMTAGGATTVFGATLSGLAVNSGFENIGYVSGQYVIDPNLLGVANALAAKLDNSLTNLRSQAQALGSNVALLTTRLNFTNNYQNLLLAGGGKLTLADLNGEGANMLSLQTRQSLGVQSLSFASQNEKAVLQLFR